MSERDRIDFWSNFIEEHLESRLRTVIGVYPSDGDALTVTFQAIQLSHPKEADELLANPRAWIEAGTKAVQEFIAREGYLTIVSLSDLKLRVTDLPEAERVAIHELRASDRGRSITFDGQVKSIKDREEVLQVAAWTCNACTNVVKFTQDNPSLNSPSKCKACGTTGTYRLDVLKSLYINQQEVLIQEPLDDLRVGKSPKSVVLRLVEDHIDTLAPGDRVTVTGVYSGEHERKSRAIKTWVDVTDLRKKGDDLLLFKPDSDFVERAVAFAQKEPIGSILDLVAGDIYGHTFEKTAILLSILGGVRRKRPNGSIRRGDTHVLLIGDPGLAKSQLMRLLARIAPRAIFTSGGGSSKAGLTAAVVKDEFGKNGGYALEAGAMVLANGGTLFVDEGDKMSKDDRAAMHEALEQQTVTIAKAGVNTTLRSMCSVVMSMNPKEGKFDATQPILPQFDMPPSFASRFDLMIPMLDRKNRERDGELAEHIGGLELEVDGKEPPELGFVKKYVSYAKRLEPKMTREAVAACTDYYKTVRAAAENMMSRQLEGLFRLSEAHAKLHLRPEVTRLDADFAVSMHKQYVKLVGHDPFTGELDLGMVSGLGHTLGQEARMKATMAAVRELSKEKMYAVTGDVVNRLKQFGISEEAAEKSIEALRRSNRLYQPGGGGTLAPL